MLSRKLKWYPLFDDRKDLDALFVSKPTVVHRTLFGEVLLVKTIDEFHAFKNRCPHQNKPLNACWLEDDQIVCPFHRYHFSVENGRGHGTSMEKYELRFENGKVEIGKEVWSLF